VPTLGGIGFFISLMLVIGVSGAIQDSKTLIILSGGLTLLFFIGLKDDIFMLAPVKKFLGQLIASTLLITLADLRIIGFSNLLSVETLPYWVSIAFTVFVFILIINAVNLIDGINGLAGSIGLMASLVFAIIFYLTNNWIPATLAVALAGALVPFLRLNMLKPKIFMGDTGSMILGFMLAFFTISFINQSQSSPEAIFHNSVPVMVEAILFFPLLDTLRIFMIRIFVHKTSPFKADRNHIHHRLLDLGHSHIRSTTLIVLMNLGIITLALAIKNLEIHVQLVIVSGVGSLLFLMPFLKKIRNS
jgi:UDP-N-acetylmuramyl pentapeptide phosphotransferase/UDP-N-acetylglucosamine-1-phosphate transferase